LNNAILNIEIQEFINNNLNSDITSMLLKWVSFKGVDTRELIEQIEAKRKCRKKLPYWFNSKNIYYPNKLNIEQTSSEITAQYKSQLISGNSIIDITGGFGVDCYYFSKRFERVTHCEIDKNLSNLVGHNFRKLKVKNIYPIRANGVEYLKASKVKYDWIYTDPSRRHDSKGKVFFLQDCKPNIPRHLEMLFEHAHNIMIKTSPLLDISVGINELKYVKTIHVVAVNNDLKELLWVLENGYRGSVSIKTINIKKEKLEQFNFLAENETHAEIKYSMPLSYLYEPNAAILKAGGFNSVAQQLQLFKLHKHSHLYTSNKSINFPGRLFKIEKIIPFNKKLFKKEGITKANITIRNFPENVQQLRKKLNIKEGGDVFLFFTTALNDVKLVVVTSK